MKYKYTDKELLDYLQKLNDEKGYTGKCVLKRTIDWQGWRLKETDTITAVKDVRQAVINFMEKE